MSKIPKKLTNVLTVVVVLAIVVGAGLFFLLRSDSTKKVTAQFTSAVGVYPGTPVKILGIDVGQVTSVKPNGATVTVKMEYESKYDLPQNVVALTVANSLVSDRYIQLEPAYSGKGPTFASGGTLGANRTAAPAELDDIYAALNKLSVSLGPNGAKQNGALSELIKVSAANLKGNGADLGNTISKLSAAATTLANGRGDLFGTVRNLQTFTKALADSDGAVRHFNEQLATVAGQLASERSDLGQALQELGIALNKVASFVKDNADKLHTNIVGLEKLTGILLHQKGSLDETLSVAPIALANLVHTYQPDIGALGTRSNLASLADPAALCALLDPSAIPGVPKSVTAPLGPISATLKKTCSSVLSKIQISKLLGLLGLPSGTDPGQLPGAIKGIVGGLTGGLTGGGGGGGPLGGVITGGG